MPSECVPPRLSTSATDSTPMPRARGTLDCMECGWTALAAVRFPTALESR